MTAMTATKARANFYKLMDQAAESHQPVHVLGKRNNVVIVSEEDWNSIQETLYIESIPGLKKSILKAMKTPSSKFYKKLSW